MDILEKILTLDNEFLSINNNHIIDNNLDAFHDFSKKRDSLIKDLESIFSDNTYPEHEKKEILDRLTLSTSNITSKISKIKNQMNERMIKSNRYKNAYQTNPIAEGSFFIDKLV